MVEFPTSQVDHTFEGFTVSTKTNIKTVQRSFSLLEASLVT